MEKKITTRCALLELPAELRNRIYRESLVSDSPIKIESIEHFTEEIDIPDYLKKAAEKVAKQGLEPPLLRTCRQIRAEATSIYYGENVFSIKEIQEGSFTIRELQDGRRWRNYTALHGFLAKLGLERRQSLGGVVMGSTLHLGKASALEHLFRVERDLKILGVGLRKGVVKVRFWVWVGEGNRIEVLMNEEEVRKDMTDKDREEFEMKIRGSS